MEALNECEFKYWETACSTDAGGPFLREMWFNREAGAPPQGREPVEQQPGEPSCALFFVPPQGASPLDGRNLSGMRGIVHAQTVKEGEALREFGMQQGLREPICRTEVGMKNRVDRLRAIGNGQVPEVARIAWEILK